MPPEALGAERDKSGAEYVHPQTARDVNAVPDAVREAARKAFDARPKDVLVADLVFDSLLDGDRRASVDPDRRSLRFGVPDAGVDVTVVEVDERLNILVQVLPAQKCEVEVRLNGPAFTLSTDDAGRVEFDTAPGLMSLLVRPAGSPQSRPLQTAWVRV
jgi:hypothetical protein